MSFNRGIYDQCSYKNELQRNVGILGHIIDVKRFEHDNPRRHIQGFVAGNNVSHISGSLIDLESDLLGQTRYISKCASSVFVPSNDGIIRNDKTPDIDTTKKHLKSVQSIAYPSVPLPYTSKEGLYARCFE